MAERADSSDPHGANEDRKPEPSEHNTEDIVFPEGFRKLWRTLLGPWGRR